MTRPKRKSGDVWEFRFRERRIKITIDVYTQAVTEEKGKGQSKVVEMIVPKKAVSQVATA